MTLTSGVAAAMPRDMSCTLPPAVPRVMNWKLVMDRIQRMGNAEQRVETCFVILRALSIRQAKRHALQFKKLTIV